MKNSRIVSEKSLTREIVRFVRVGHQSPWCQYSADIVIASSLPFPFRFQGSPTQNYPIFQVGLLSSLVGVADENIAISKGNVFRIARVTQYTVSMNCFGPEDVLMIYLHAARGSRVGDPWVDCLLM